MITAATIIRGLLKRYSLTGSVVCLCDQAEAPTLHLTIRRHKFVIDSDGALWIDQDEKPCGYCLFMARAFTARAFA